MDELSLRVVRLRLPARRGHLYLLRHQDVVVDPAAYPGAERLLSSDGRLLAGTSPRTLLAASAAGGVAARPVPGMVVLDVRAVGHRLSAPPERWTGRTRGTVAEFDDLLWDAAATCDDPEWAEQVRDPAGFHGLYAYVWGDAEGPPAASLRQAWWRDMADRLLDHVVIVPHG